MDSAIHSVLVCFGSVNVGEYCSLTSFLEQELYNRCFFS